jgi:hypothetical protein
MMNISGILIFDISMITSLLVMGYLSKCLGDALKIRPYYLMLYIAAALVFGASIINIFTYTGTLGVPSVITNSIRLFAGTSAFCVCLRYWSWLFSEFFGS